MTAQRDYFDFLGLEPKLALDTAALQRRFYELSREWHPDRFTRKSPGEQQQALDNTALLNDAFRTLRDPIARAEYALKAQGFDIGEQRSKDVPPELLEEVFELNMALEEIRGGDDSVRPDLEAAKQKFLALREASDRELAEQFARHDAAEDKSVLEEIRANLNRRRYIRNLIAEVEKELSRETFT